MTSFVKYAHSNPLKHATPPCESGCVAYRINKLKSFRENAEVLFEGLLTDGTLNHYHGGEVSLAEGLNLCEFGQRIMSSEDFSRLDLSVGPWHPGW